MSGPVHGGETEREEGRATWAPPGRPALTGKHRSASRVSLWQSSPSSRERCCLPAWTQPHSSPMKLCSKVPRTNKYLFGQLSRYSQQTLEVHLFNSGTLLNSKPDHFLASQSGVCHTPGATWVPSLMWHVLRLQKYLEEALPQLTLCSDRLPPRC